MRELYYPEKSCANTHRFRFSRLSNWTTRVRLMMLALLLVISSSAFSQLGVYEFNALLLGSCPTQNPVVNSQPANATFSSFTTVNTRCKAQAGVANHEEWNTGGTIDLTEYSQFSITADPGYALRLTSFSFRHQCEDEDNLTTNWVLRSSVDNYTTNLGTGVLRESWQTPSVVLPASHSGITNVTFRLYVINSESNGNEWTVDDVSLFGTVVAPPADPANPTSDSPQCSNPGVTLTRTGTPPAGVTWYWQTTATGTSTVNSGATYVVNTSGTYYLRAQDDATLVWSTGAGSVTIAITPDVSTPVFVLGASSTRCDAVQTITYTANASNSTGITYTLDAASLAAGNTINGSTGAVTYVAGWTSNSVITASAAGCNGPTTADHTVSVVGAVAAPVFTLGANSTRCQGAGVVTYDATATNASGITYALDAASIAGGNTINATTGAVTYVAGWSGTSTITANAAGCNGPTSASHTITITPSVTTPVFTSGATSTRCQGAGSVNYGATTSNSTGITYTLDAASIAAGNSIDGNTGDVTYVATWSGTSIITASAAGCNGPSTANHTVTVSPTVGTPVFALGATSTRCQAAGSVTYSATASSSTGIIYSLDAASIAAGNSINASTGAVTYVAGWVGTSTITATAAGCSGPSSADHIVTTTPTIGVPVFALGATSTRCQGAGSVVYSATSTDATGITYSLNAAALAGGNSINATTGAVTYVAGWTGATVITASAAGCGGPRTSIHTVTITPTVGLPSFTLGAASSRCNGAGTVTYTANATNTTGITYSLDAASIAAGNTIDANTGMVTYVAGYVGVSTITASAAGCNGPRTANHNATSTANVGTPTFTLGASSTRCQGNGNVNYGATASNSTSITYSLDAASIAGGNSINASSGLLNYAAGWSGTSIITATAAGCNGPSSSTHTVTITPTVGVPVFTLGATSTRCTGASTITYDASATNSTGITYSIDLASSLGGVTINAATGAVTYPALWVGTTTITASAAGCNGPRTANHTVTIVGNVGTPVFTLGATSSRCQGAGSVVYTATAVNNSGITYSLDAASLAAGNTINASTGAVMYDAAWVGVSTITATAAGCSGPTTASHTATTNAPVTVPVFTLGATSTRCQGAGSVAYPASASNTTGITYSLNAASLAAGNTINASTGTVTYVAGWSGTSTITASAAGCAGPQTAVHTVTITPTVGTPTFTLGASTTRCQGAATGTYSASATNTTGITFSIDAASIAGGVTVNAATGAVTYPAGWFGTTSITASAAGCNGPRTAVHTVTTNPSVATPVFTLGATTTRCQGGGSVTYTATAANNTGLTYSLDAASLAGGNTINASTGAVTYSAGWSGTTTITVSAAGCNGPRTANHVVTVTATVGVPVFTLGATSTRCQGATSVTYTATASSSTSLTYVLDSASLANGITINSSTGAVNFTATWTGTSVITVTATGCNGPRTSSHTVTTGGSVTTPFFTLGGFSIRMQAAGTVTYDATASNTSGITYSLDAASLAGGNTINASTGAVTYAASWSGPSTITASAAGCNGPRTAAHIVNTNATSVYKQLYLSDPAQSLDRIDPVNTADATTANTGILSTAGTATTSFTQTPVLCSDLNIKAGTITVRTYITVSTGTMPANPTITARLHFSGNDIIILNNPVFAGGMLTWTGTLPADVPVPAGMAISLQITTTQAGVNFRIDYDSQTRPSRIDIPVSTFISLDKFDIYNAPYPGGIVVSNGIGGTTKYIRGEISDPFGVADITGFDVRITPPGTTFAATQVGTNGCTKIYEYVWNTPMASGNYSIAGTAKEGFENTVSHIRNLTYDICTTCAPVAVADSASGAGGTPLVVDVLANDYDPNNNLNTSSLTIVNQPKNGSAYIANNMIVYLPNGTFQGRDTLVYRICDLTSPVPQCATAYVFLDINPLIIDICGDASKTHTYFIPYPEQQSFTVLENAGSPANPSNNLRTVISLKIPYPGMVVVWDEWEDGYEANALNPTQSTTKVWGDGDPFNGIAPGFPTDIISAGASIVLDNTMNANPRNPAQFYYDGKDKVVSSGQIALTQVTGEPSIMSVQAIKTNVTSTYDFGQSFTVPLGQDFPSQDFRYTGLFIRAAEDSTVVSIDKDNNGTFETTAVLNQGNSYLVDGGVLTGATVASNKPVGVELSAGGVDNYSIRNAPIFPATWYGSTYYTPVPTSDNPLDNPKDSSVVMFYNSLNRSININWTSGAPASGTITVPARSAIRFPLAYSTTAAYKFVNPTGESYTAIEIVGSYSPGGGGASGSAYDWAFNLISEQRLTDYTTVAWAPGGLDLGGAPGPDVNGNPIWVTPNVNTTIYVKYDGNITGSAGLISPCGLRYDVAYNLNALNYIKIRDTDNDQGGIAVYTCNGAKIAAVYGEDPQGSTAGASAYWDVGTTIQPFCKQKLLIATDDYATSLVSQPVTITVLDNDFGFLATIDPTTVATLGLLQPQHGTVTINSNGTILYRPDIGFSGTDTFEYRVCSTPSPIVCDIALVVVRISTCPSNGNQNIISGQVFIDRDKDGLNDDGGGGLAGVKVYLYTDGNCSGTPVPNELTDSVTVDTSGYYQFTKYPEKNVEDNFDNGSGGRTCNNGTDGDAAWSSNWTDGNDASVGFCNTSQTEANTDVEIMRDGAFGFALRLKDNDVFARRSVNLNGAIKAFLTFSYRRKSATMSAGENVYVQASTNGAAFNTIYTIAGDGTADAGYVTIYNQDISSYATTNAAIRFLTSSNLDDQDTVYIDNVSIKFLRYPQCYITQVAMATVPPSYTATTATQRTITINAGGTCTSQFDYGFGKPNITISGTLYNDNDGLVDGVVDGTPLGNPGGATVYAYLADFAGNVALKTTVNAGTGAYSFPLAEINTDYTLILSTNNVLLGGIAPLSPGFAATWVGVGDSYGTNNLAGTGNEPGNPNVAIAIRTAAVNVTNVNFGIQRVPDSDNKLRSINHPSIGQMITLNGVGLNPPVLSGTDPEDCVSGCMLTSRSATIDQVPNNAEMYYNGALLVSGQTISNFNPSLLQIRVTAATVGDTAIQFLYSYVDAAIAKDPTPATYRIVWMIPLPAVGLNATATLNGNTATVKWTTISEDNTSYFVVERSTDNVTFTQTGGKVNAAGYSQTRQEYQLPDNIASLTQNEVIYYRVKLVDIDGKTTYSNVVAVRLSKKPGVTIWPNPFTSSVTISVTATKDTEIIIKLIDVNGRLIRNISQPASRGITQITVRDLDQLPGGVYLVEITDKNAGTTFQKLLKNHR